MEPPHSVTISVDGNGSSQILANSATIFVFFIYYCFVFKNVFQGKQMLFGDFPSFEYLSAVLKCSPRVLLLIIYGPPTYSAKFFNDFTELLSSISTEFDCLVITGDFNFHTDDLNVQKNFLPFWTHLNCLNM